MNGFAGDPLLDAVRQTREARDNADHALRVLLAFARELAEPRPYRLVDLSAASGLSIAGVRTAYSRSDVDKARELFGVPSHLSEVRPNSSRGSG